MILKIPKLKSSFIKNGFDKLHYNALFEPTRILGSSTDQIYLDSVLVTLLSHAKQSKSVLDLGSYFGMLPFVVEDLYRRAGATSDIKWSLVDNCTYVKELHQHLIGETPLSGNYMSAIHSAEWAKDKIQSPTRNLFSSNNEYCLPPINAEQFQQYWEKLATDYLGIKSPDMTMYEDLNLLEGQKFDFVIFDLSAGQFRNSIDVFSKLQEYVTDDVVILIDDVSVAHPETMALFHYIMEAFDYIPVAFSPGKVAVMHPAHKEKFMLQAESYITVNEMNIDLPDFYCYFKTNEVWGSYFQLKT